MKILLTMNLPFLRSYGGANRSNRSLVESLAARGHELRVVVPALGTPASITHEEFLRDLRERNIRYVSSAEHDMFCVAGAEIIAVREPSRLRASLLEAIRSYEPDWVLVSSEDQSQNLLEASLFIWHIHHKCSHLGRQVYIRVRREPNL
jgi:glycosyltransferase involved in cell wall biosynthesis